MKKSKRVNYLLQKNRKKGVLTIEKNTFHFLEGPLQLCTLALGGRDHLAVAESVSPNDDRLRITIVDAEVGCKKLRILFLIRNFLTYF